MDYVFGDGSRGDAAAERARTSTVEFVRSQDHLSVAKPSATGRRLTASEAFDAYGLETLCEVMDHGAAVLAASVEEPAATLSMRRAALGLSVDELARVTGLSVAQVQDCENAATRSPIRHLERIAATLGLDERKISFEPGAGGDDGLAVRLRTLGAASQRLSARVVATLAEAAWVIRTQARMRDLLGTSRPLPAQFVPSSNYGSADYPTWQHGYFLAAQARDVLRIPPTDPINSIREVCELMQIPLLCATLPDHLAGATVVSAGLRGIVVNTAGWNTNVWVRRATIAHELGHLLWDPESKLDRVRVDSYDEVKDLDRGRPDYVEARANAFAIEFIAPLAAVRDEFSLNGSRSAGLRAVMERFGISYTAAKYHVWNAFDRSFDRETLRVDDIDPTADWRGRESFTDDYFPLEETSALRRGTFAGLVVQAQRRGLISVDTACAYLQTTADKYVGHAGYIADIFGVEQS